jgi:hypothetical protein
LLHMPNMKQTVSDDDALFSERWRMDFHPSVQNIFSTKIFLQHINIALWVRVGYNAIRSEEVTSWITIKLMNVPSRR